MYMLDHDTVVRFHCIKARPVSSIGKLVNVFAKNKKNYSGYFLWQCYMKQLFVMFFFFERTRKIVETFYYL